MHTTWSTAVPFQDFATDFTMSGYSPAPAGWRRIPRQSPATSADCQGPTVRWPLSPRDGREGTGIAARKESRPPGRPDGREWFECRRLAVQILDAAPARLGGRHRRRDQELPADVGDGRATEVEQGAGRVRGREERASRRGLEHGVRRRADVRSEEHT